MKLMATMSCQELTRKKEELAARLGPRLRADGFAEFSQLVDKACAIESTDDTNSMRLVRRAEEMLPQVERSVENILSIRDQIEAKMLQFADEGMDRYDQALKELAK
jgi:hypothetical protein